VERQLYKSTTLALNYAETRGVKLFRSPFFGRAVAARAARRMQIALAFEF
jgi:hypothetical protein